MRYRVVISNRADKVIRKWMKSNPQLFKKYQEILYELADHPPTGIGHPEPLKNGDGITYSRRISAHDRIIYNIYDERVTVIVIKLGGHYDDK